jgi:hypothetical protein
MAMVPDRLCNMPTLIVSAARAWVVKSQRASGDSHRGNDGLEMSSTIHHVAPKNRKWVRLNGQFEIKRLEHSAQAPCQLCRGLPVAVQDPLKTSFRTKKASGVAPKTC